MRIIITHRPMISRIHPDIQDVHIGYRPAEKDIFALMFQCPNLKSIQLPKGFHKSISNTVRQLLTLNGIELLEGRVLGSEKYID